ncbi:MAG TPA: DUF5335 family protein [Anaerolineae bacterium]|nr:DUF5335 family protein [Anaerolineae bacterium]
MPTDQIRQSEWDEFLDDFSQTHEEWLVTIEVRGTEAPEDSDVLLREAPFWGLSMADEGGMSGMIAVAAGENRERHVTHIIPEPARITVERDPDGTDRALRIEARDGTTTIVWFEGTGPRA